MKGSPLEPPAHTHTHTLPMTGRTIFRGRASLRKERWGVAGSGAVGGRGLLTDPTEIWKRSLSSSSQQPRAPWGHHGPCGHPPPSVQMALIFHPDKFPLTYPGCPLTYSYDAWNVIAPKMDNLRDKCPRGRAK